ncbi:S-antigen protein [Oryzias melastigma]|uniref:S-antigen protein n=1 Tax=Oryzias melastigma TaxID=30732 RepID=A0A834KX89_ORYME|nr:S-antigen protein [Oryzias melastigma]
MDKRPKPEEQAENIPPEAKTSKLKFQSNGVEQQFREDNGTLLKTCICSTPAPSESKSRLSGVLSTLSPILKYLNIENKQSPPQSVKCASSSSCLRSTGKPAHHSSFNVSAMHSGTLLGATHQPYCLLDYECLPEITLLDDTNNATMELTRNDSVYPQSAPPAPNPNAVTCGQESNANSPACTPQPPGTQKHKMVKLSEMKRSSAWNRLLDENLPEITLLDTSSDSEMLPRVQTSCRGAMLDLTQDKTQNLAQNITHDVVQDKMNDMMQIMGQDIVQDLPVDMTHDKMQDMVQNMELDMVQDNTKDMLEDKTQDTVQDIELDTVQNLTQDTVKNLTQDVLQDKTQDMVPDIQLDVLQDVLQDKTQDLVQDKTQDVLQDKTQDVLQDETQDMTQDVLHDNTQDVLQDKTQDLVQDKTQDVLQDKTQDVLQDKTQDLVQDKTQDLVQDKTQDLVQDKTQDLVQDKTQDLLHDKTQDVLHDKTQDVLHDKTQDVLHDKTQDVLRDKTQDVLQDVLQDKTQDLVQDKTQDVLQDKTQDMLQDKTQDLVQDKTQDLVQDETQDLVQDETQDLVQDKTQDFVQDVLQDKTQDLTHEKTQDVLQDKTQDMAHEKTQEVLQDLLQDNTQDKMQDKMQEMVQDLAQNKTQDVVQDKTLDVVQNTELDKTKGTVQNKDQDMVQNLTQDKTQDFVQDVLENRNDDASEVLNPELPDSAETRSKMVKNPEGTVETPPALDLLSGGDNCQREDVSQPVLHMSMELSDSSIVSSMDTNKTNTLVLDKSLDSVPDPKFSSTPMIDLKIFNFKTLRDEGQVLAAQKKLYQDGLSKPADQVPSEIPSNIVADRKTFLPQTGSKLLWPLSKATSQLPKISNSGVKSTIPRKPESSQSHLPMKRQRIQDSVRKPVPPEGPQGITDEQSLPSLCTRAAVFKLPASGLQRPQVSKMTKPAATVRKLPTRVNSQVVASADKPCGSKDAVKQLSSTEASSRTLKQPAVRQKSLLTKPQRQGCANCSVLEEQLKRKTEELEKIQEELFKYTKKSRK